MTLPQIVIPMAGQGQRFTDAGYPLPKPLLPVAGIPMVVRAILDLPRASRVVLLVRSEHIRQHAISREILAHLPHAIIVPVERLTEGQACTVRLAAPHLDPAAPVIVGACDNTHLYDHERLAAKMADPGIAALIWTYRGEPRVQVKPTAYGWVAVDGERALQVSCKSPLSGTPLSDHAISGCFSFHRADTMIAAIDRMVDAGIRINGEFYLDIVPNLLLAAGMRVEVFEVEKYIGWGTPADYEDFCKWERYLRGLR